MPASADHHPLNRRWTLYEQSPVEGQTLKDYERAVSKVYTVESVEEFTGLWKWYPSVKNVLPEGLAIRAGNEFKVQAISWFADDYQPIVESELMKSGFSIRAVISMEDAGRLWKNLVLQVLGETFSSDRWAEIVGIRIEGIRSRGKKREGREGRGRDGRENRERNTEARVELWVNGVRQHDLRDKFAAAMGQSRSDLPNAKYHPGHPKAMKNRSRQ